MNEITTTAAPGRSRGRLPRCLRLVIGMAAATCVLVLGAGAASAAEWGSQWGHIPPQSGYFGDCVIMSGPVWDQSGGAPPNFAVIGGGLLDCRTPHTYQMWTQEYFSMTGAPGSYYLVATGYYSASNAGTPMILESGRVCGNGYWFTDVTVRLPGYGAWHVPSYANQVQANGRGGGWC